MFKTKKIIISLVVIISLILPFGITASANSVSVTEYSIPFSQPTSDENSGYIEILLQDSSGNKYVRVQSWQFVLEDFEIVNIKQSFSMSFNVTSKSITYTGGYNKVASASTDYVYTFTKAYITQTGGYVVDSTTSSKDSGTTSFATVSGEFWVAPSETVLGVKIYGNYSVLSKIDSANGGSWVVVYGGDNAVLQELEAIKSILRSKSNDDIIANQDENTNKITQNDDENTQAIIDNQNDLAEKEKTETQNQGEGSVNDVSGAIEDKSAGFISSIGNLVSAMSYNGTSCAWKFPALKLPAIDGVMSEIKLSDEKPIDFEYWVNKIPSNILLLVRSVLTIALIVYCFKELYNTISYVLTLKGGGNDE